MKCCCACEDELSETEFHRNSRARDGLCAMCKKCKSNYNKARTFQPAEDPTRTKRCADCGKDKPATLEFFSPHKRNSDGMCYSCKTCNNQKVQDWNNKHKELCVDCGKDKPTCVRLPDGGSVCADCRRKRRTEPCAECGRKRPVERRLPDGTALCSWCSKKRHLEICSDCGEESVPNVRLPNGSIRCSTCQRRRSPEAMYAVYKRGAEQRQLDFTLTAGQFEALVTQVCHYCGDSADIPGHMIGVDRLDNSRGYLPENVVPCCWTCNLMKGKLGKERFLSRVHRISSHCP